MLAFRPCRDEFVALAERGNTVPVYAELLSDNLTPVTAFARVAEASDHAFLLESVVGGEKIARYSFIATAPIGLFEARGQSVRYAGAEETWERQSEDPLGALQDVLNTRRAVALPELPRFVGGVVGYVGYDVVRQYEPLGEGPPDDRRLPDVLLGLYESMIIFDHVKKVIYVVAHGNVSGRDPSAAYEQACERIVSLVDHLSHPRLATVQPVDLHSRALPVYESSMTREQFEAAVRRCKEYILAGDIFQVVISQRLTLETSADPFDIYRAFRVVNPSPFMFYLKSPQVVLVGASPEILCRVEDGTVTNRPLAGTRPRGRTEAEDQALERELLLDPKERAEHVMLVDLGRNDLGRVCEPGSVQITELMTIERYSHVMHICSNVTGRLAPGRTAVDALRATLPVGTVTGAPKVRAMQIIDELEPVRRGPYAGAVGYIDLTGNMDTCIALRTLVITPAGFRRRVDIQVGAGIVADSEPQREYQETLNKAEGMLRAVALAESAL